jgi:hypothetical protein
MRPPGASPPGAHELSVCGYGGGGVGAGRGRPFWDAFVAAFGSQRMNHILLGKFQRTIAKRFTVRPALPVA